MSLNTPSLDLVLLAGGRGRRLEGIVKPLLRRSDGRTLLEHQVMHLPGDAVLVVAPGALRQALDSVVGALAERSKKPVLFVEDPGRGPGVAIARAARLSAAARLLVVAGDHVAPSRRLAEILLEAMVEDVDGAWVVREEGGPEPLFTVVDRYAVIARTDESTPSARRLFAALTMSAVAFSSLDEEARAGLEDVDTPQQADAADLSVEGVPRWG